MPFPSTMHSLRRVFYQGFSVCDIAEPLVSFDGTSPATEVRKFMESRGFEVVGVRDNGLVTGYVIREELAEDACSIYVHPFEESQILPDTASLANVVARLNELPRIFVAILGQINGIATRSDLQKPPVRMWLFGMVSLIEMRMSRLIQRYCPGNEWTAYLSPSRVEKAQQLLTERARRNQELSLIDCLQFSDKGQIIARNQEIRDATRFTSRRQVESAAKRLERLRNNLAHSQDIIASDWEAIVLLAADLDNILAPREDLNESL